MSKGLIDGNMTVDDLKNELEARNELKSGNTSLQQGVAAAAVACGDFAGAAEGGARAARGTFWLR